MEERHGSSTGDNGAGDQEPRKKSGKKGSRKRTLSFVLIFLTCVLGLLMGYRYAIESKVNEMYLYAVALHTSYALDKVGYLGTLEEDTIALNRGKEAMVRATLHAWERGEEVPTEVAESPGGAPPLTQWEAFQYRLGRERRGPVDRGDNFGVKVDFVLKPGLQRLTREKQEKLTELRKAQEQNRQAIAQLEGEVKELQAKLTSQAPDNDDAQRFDKGFDFTLVPDCGAIPSMSIFIAAVLAFPARIWKRLLGVLLGVPFLYCVNVFRLVCLAIIGSVTTPAWFKFFHEYVWQGIYIVFVVAAWLLWVEFLVLRRD